MFLRLLSSSRAPGMKVGKVDHDAIPVLMQWLSSPRRHMHLQHADKAVFKG